ncbi:MAG TPA: sigma-70 family RNA polymerase sigma factor [Dehalococcoidia bacterium]|nr:sigma-70 family RNA polymerase sigma factor [Dehalococcoidia bacterium]
MQDEKALAQRLKRRDPEAWAWLYEQYCAKVYRYIVLRVQNQTEAEDLTEQVFLKALESGPSFKWRGAPISSWLFRIARNLVIDYWRTDKSRRTLPLDSQPLRETVDPAEKAELKSDIQQLIQAVEQLTKAQREVIELRFAAGLSIAETAKVLGKSQGAVKVMQHSALVALRKKFSGWSNHE